MNASWLDRLMHTGWSIFKTSLWCKVRNTVPYRYFDLGSVPVWYGIPSGTPRCVEYCSTVLQCTATVLRCCSALGPVTGGPRTDNLSDRYVSPVPGGTVRYGRPYYPHSCISKHNISSANFIRKQIEFACWFLDVSNYLLWACMNFCDLT